VCQIRTINDIHRRRRIRRLSIAPDQDTASESGRLRTALTLAALSATVLLITILMQ